MSKKQAAQGAAKDSAITALVANLARDLPEGSFVISSEWDSDLCAVGIADPGDPSRLVYVSTYQMAPGLYYVDCDRGDDSETHDSVDYVTLVRLVCEHIGINP